MSSPSGIRWPSRSRPRCWKRWTPTAWNRPAWRWQISGPGIWWRNRSPTRPPVWPSCEHAVGPVCEMCIRDRSISWRASPGRRRGADIVAYACFPAKSLLLLVMAIYRRDRYTCVTKQKGGQSMEENVKNLCAPIPAGLHARVREEQEVSGKTLGQYMAWLIQTFYDNQKEETTRCV